MRTLFVMLAFSVVALAQQPPPNRFHQPNDSGIPRLFDMEKLRQPKPLTIRFSAPMPQLLDTQKLPELRKAPQLVDPRKLLQPKLLTEPILIARARQGVVRLRTAGATATTCSVPLIEAPIPKDVEFTMRQITPRTEAVAPMPQARVPAPPCEPAAAQ